MEIASNAAMRKTHAMKAAAVLSEVCETFVIVGTGPDGGTVVAAKGDEAEVEKLKNKVQGDPNGS